MKLFQQYTNGRTNRTTFFVASVASILIMPLLYIFNIIYNKDFKNPLIPLILLLVIVLCLSYIGIIGTKRRHDIGLSGEDDPNFFRYLSYRGMLIGGWLYYLLKPGQQGPNNYGPQPKPGIDWKSLFGISK